VFACASERINTLEVSGDRWRAIVSDIGEESLDLEESTALRVAASLLHQAMTASFEGSPDYWRLSNSTRQWYENRPHRVAEGIEMIGRISFSTIELPGHGVGIAIDRGHLFRTEWTVADVFDPSLSNSERRRRQQRFDRLRDASGGRKGTLIYRSNAGMLNKCYFVDFARGATCASVGPIEIPGESYASLHEYYTKRKPRLKVQPSDTVAYVSFPSSVIRKDVPVPARLLHLRVMLDKDSMPREFRKETTMSPGRRRSRITKTWDHLDAKLLNATGLSITDGFWAPGQDQTEQLPCPAFEFGNGRIVTGPAALDLASYQNYYRQRRRALESSGVCHFNETGHRELVIVTPTDARWSADMRDGFVNGLIAQVRKLAGRDMPAKIVRADSCEQIVERLDGMQASMAAIVFDDSEPAAYSILAHDLKEWQIKRFRSRQIERAWQARAKRGEVGERRWQDVLFHSAIDILDQMGSTPWRLVDPPYEASIAIDVSAERRYFGLSLIVTRKGDRWPAQRRVTKTWHKGDHQHEGINPKMLRLKILELFDELESAEPIDSLLLIRDGRECGSESRGIADALDALKRKGLLSQSATVDVIDLLKRTVKDLRMWRVDDGKPENIFEGRVSYLDGSTALLCCTGAGTLSKYGTAEPSIIRAHDGSCVRRASRGVFALAQLNYSSPTKAHRYPLPIRETDSALQERVDRDMRGIK
jgi:hypothetical protein